jgi:hypothetical protein
MGIKQMRILDALNSSMSDSMSYNPDAHSVTLSRDTFQLSVRHYFV